MKLCGENGHKAKDGHPCGFKIADTAFSCHHHATDKTRQREIVDAMRLAQKQLRIPDSIKANGFQTTDDCLRVYSQIVDILTTEKHPDIKRLNVAIRATNGAMNAHGVKAAEEQNKILLLLDGHGAGLAAMQRLKESPLRVLPGRRTPPTDKGTA